MRIPLSAAINFMRISSSYRTGFGFSASYFFTDMRCDSTIEHKSRSQGELSQTPPKRSLHAPANGVPCRAAESAHAEFKQGMLEASHSFG